MQRHHPDNERVKRQYFVFLKEAKRQSEASVDAAAQAIARFEAETGHRDFRSFHINLVVNFKRHLAERESEATGGKLSVATRFAMLAHLKRFFEWLSMQPGYKSKLKFTDAEYFSLSEKESRVATARRPRPVPTLEQVKHAIARMPSSTEIERRNRALVALALLTGARDSALASMRLGHVDLTAGSVFQDARVVKTKFSKTFTTYFFPVGDEIKAIVTEWVGYLRGVRLWGNEDPLFPATSVELGGGFAFEAVGIKRQGWATAAPIREVFRHAFEAAGLPYFNPHSLRSTLAQLGEQLCQTPEEFKAWSQNLGHEGVLTTFHSYGSVAPRRQGEIIHSLGRPSPRPGTVRAEELAEAVVRVMEQRGVKVSAASEAQIGSEV